MQARRLGGLGTVIVALAWVALGAPPQGALGPAAAFAVTRDTLTVRFKTPSDTLQLERVNRLLGTRVTRKLGPGHFQIQVPRRQRLNDYSALYMALPGVADVSPYPRDVFTLHPQVSINAQNRTRDRRERVETTTSSPSPAISPGAPTVTDTTSHREETTVDQNVGIPVPISGGREVFVTFRGSAERVREVSGNFNAVFGTKTVEQQGFRVFRLRLPDGLDADRAARIFTLVPDVSSVEPTYGR